MTIDPREQAAAFLASLSDESAAELVAQARRPRGQITDAELTSMSPDQINQARRDGRLDSLLGKN